MQDPLGAIRLQPLIPNNQAGKAVQLKVATKRLQLLKRQLQEQSGDPKDLVNLEERSHSTGKAKTKRKKKTPQSKATKPLVVSTGKLPFNLGSSADVQGQKAFGSSWNGSGGGLVVMGNANMSMSSPIAVEEVALQHTEVEPAAELDLPVQEIEPLADSSDSQAMMMASASFDAPPSESVEVQPQNLASTAEEVAEKVEATVKEELVDGITAVNQQIEETSQQVKELQAKTSAAQEAIKQEAPKFSATLAALLEGFQSATNRQNQETIQAEIVALLDGTSDALKPHVDKVRGQTSNLFEQTKAAWEARDAAKDLANPDAKKLSQEHREKRPLGGSRSQTLQGQFRQRAYDSRLTEKLKAAGKKQTDLSSTLKRRGALGDS